MKLSTFWNKAFLAALHRMPADKALEEADEATRLAVAAWQRQPRDLVPTMTFRGDLDLAKHPMALSTIAPSPSVSERK